MSDPRSRDAVTAPPAPVTASTDPLFAGLALCLIVGIAAWLRFEALNEPGLWIDEIFGVWGYGSEHGPLYYAVIRLGVALGDSETTIRTPFALAGLAAVVTAFAAGRSLAGTSTGMCASLFVSTMATYAYYSREARPYILMLAIDFVGLGAVIRMSQSRRHLHHGVVAACSLVLVLLSAHGLFYVASLLTGSIVAGFRRRAVHVQLADAAWIVATGATSLSVFLWVYRAMLAEPAGTWFAPVEWSRLLTPLVTGQLEAPIQSLPAGAAAACLGLGALCLLWRRPHATAALIVTCAVGVLLPVLSLVMKGHWFHPRYVFGALPGVTLLAAGVGSIVEWRLPTAWAGRHAPVTSLVTGAVTIGWLFLQHPTVVQANLLKPDWRVVANEISRRALPGDVVVTSNHWAAICLSRHLPEKRYRVTVVNGENSLDKVQQVARDAGQAFVVSASNFTPPGIERWMAQSYELYVDRRERIFVGFYPDRVHFLASRASLQELGRDESMLWETLDGHVDLQAGNSRFLLDGWGEPEFDARRVGFRWIVGRTASVYLPVVRRAPRHLRVDVRPSEAIDGQVLDMVVNGSVAMTARLSPGWQRLDLELAGSGIRHGGNIVELRLARAQRAGPTDARELSVAIQSVSIAAHAP